MQSLSPWQLLWVLKDARRRQAERDIRLLMITAAGAQGGKPFSLLLRDLKREAKGLTTQVEAEPKSESPASMADLEQMMKEEAD